MPRAPTLEIGKRYDVDVEGVRVSVHLARDGRVLSAGAGFWVGDTTGERLARIAVALARAMFDAEARAGRESRVEEGRRKGTQNATTSRTRSAEKSADLVKPYFEAAQRKNPKWGPEFLLEEARSAIGNVKDVRQRNKLLALATIDRAKDFRYPGRKHGRRK